MPAPNDGCTAAALSVLPKGEGAEGPVLPNGDETGAVWLKGDADVPSPPCPKGEAAVVCAPTCPKGEVALAGAVDPADPKGDGVVAAGPACTKGEEATPPDVFFCAKGEGAAAWFCCPNGDAAAAGVPDPAAGWLNGDVAPLCAKGEVAAAEPPNAPIPDWLNGDEAALGPNGDTAAAAGAAVCWPKGDVTAL